jgi:hypothetical protein
LGYTIRGFKWAITLTEVDDLVAFKLAAVNSILVWPYLGTFVRPITDREFELFEENQKYSGLILAECEFSPVPIPGAVWLFSSSLIVF